MNKRFSAFLVGLFTFLVAAAPGPVREPDMIEISQLPPAPRASGKLYWVRDSLTGACNVGGGVIVAACYSDGTSWVARSVAGAGGGSGEINTGSNLGGGLGLYRTKVGQDLRFASADPNHFDIVNDLLQIDSVMMKEIRPTNVITLDAPDGGSNTAGIQEAIDACAGSPNTDCVIHLGKGDFNITKTCAQWVFSSGVSGIATGNIASGGGAILIGSGNQNISIVGKGPTITRVNWETEFSPTACGIAGESAALASVFRIDAGTSSSVAAKNIVLADMSIEAKQTNLSLAANAMMGMSAVEIAPTGTVDSVLLSNVYLEAANDRDDADRRSKVVSITSVNTATRQFPARRIYMDNVRIEASDTGIFVDHSADDVRIWGSWLGNVDEAGYGCSDGLVFKRDGLFSSNGNTWELHGDATNCLSPLRWAHLDGRGAQDYAAQWAKFVGDTFLVRSAALAAKVFEGFYITGYNYATISDNSFICSADLIDSTTAGDATIEACEMFVIQIDVRDVAGNCGVNTPCNVGNIIDNNVFTNFRDTVDDWNGGAGRCVFDINVPLTAAADNQYNHIAGNVLRLSNADGTLDSTHDGFCGGETGTGGTAYVPKNFIYNNTVIGSDKICMMGKGVGTCGLEYDLSDNRLTANDIRATTLLVGGQPVCLLDGTNCPAGGGGSMTSFSVHADSGTDGTVANAQVLNVIGGINGIDTVTGGTGNRTITLNIDTTEFPTIFTWGDGVSGQWNPTFNIGLGVGNPTFNYTAIGATETFGTAFGLSADSIVFGTVTSGNAGFTVPNLAIGTAEIDNSSITAGKIATGAVTTGGILDDTIGFLDIDYSITLAGNPAMGGGEAFWGGGGIIFEGPAADTTEGALVPAAITADQTWTLPDVTGTLITTGDSGSVTSAMILNGTIVAADLAADTITAGQIATGAVDTAEILDGSVTATDLAANSVDTSELVDNSVTAAKIAADSVGASELIESDNYTVNNLTVNGTFSIACAHTGDCIMLLPENTSGTIAAPAAGKGVIAMDATGVMVGILNGEGSPSRMVRVVDLTSATFTLTSSQLNALISDNIGSATGTSGGLVFATLADGNLLDLSAINGSSTTEGLKLPQATSCASSTAEGQLCWDTDDDLLNVGTGSGIAVVRPGYVLWQSKFSNTLASVPLCVNVYNLSATGLTASACAGVTTKYIAQTNMTLTGMTAVLTAALGSTTTGCDLAISINGSVQGSDSDWLDVGSAGLDASGETQTQTFAYSVSAGDSVEFTWQDAGASQCNAGSGCSCTAGVITGWLSIQARNR